MLRARTSPRPSTKQLIQEAALELFNTSGYTKTSIARIAEAVGIAEGNLWYHFRAKEDLVNALLEQLVASLNTDFEAAKACDSVQEQYVRYFYGVMQNMLRFRFLLRDYLQVTNSQVSQHLIAFESFEFARLTDFLLKMCQQGLMRDPHPDLEVLATNIWIVVRYWWSYLLDREQIENIAWKHQQRGFKQQMALLQPHLTADAFQKMSAIATKIDLQAPAELVS